MENNNKRKLKVVRREGGLIETNSSSSHAVSICMDAKTNLKQGDPDFDLDIRDGILYIPCRSGDFSWEWEKSNSCLTKLQYLCAFFFNSYAPLHTQKSQKKLEQILKRILGVKGVVFEWVENYVEDYKSGSRDMTLDCPQIDHQSYSDMRDEILENEDTIRNFILNPMSWWYGGNDNSDAPRGFYSETKITDDDCSDPDAIITIDFGKPLEVIDFAVPNFPADFSDIRYSISQYTTNSFLSDIIWDPSKQEFNLTLGYSISKSFWTLSKICIIDDKMCAVYIDSSELANHIKNKGGMSSVEELIKAKKIKNYILAPIKLWTKEFGIIYDK